jgi:Protein of unknown function (DUF3311)
MIMTDSSPGQYRAYRARPGSGPLPRADRSHAGLAHGRPAGSLQNAATGISRQPSGRLGEVHGSGDEAIARHPVEPSDTSAWHWLLWLPVVLPLITPLYNRVEPRWWGIPFFYWFQLSFVGLDIAVVTLVYQATKRRRSS